MDLDTFANTIPASKRQQSERIQISGFLRSCWDKLGIVDVAYGQPDPPDFILTLQSGTRVGVELKRLRFADGEAGKDIRAYKDRCLEPNRSPRRYVWRTTTKRIILDHLRDQLQEAENIPASAMSGHDLDQLWLMFATVSGNPAGLPIEVLAHQGGPREDGVDEDHCRFIYLAALACERVEEFDAVLINSGLYTLGLKNESGFGCLSVPQSVLDCGRRASDDLLDRRSQVDSPASNVGFLGWDNG